MQLPRPVPNAHRVSTLMTSSELPKCKLLKYYCIVTQYPIFTFSKGGGELSKQTLMGVTEMPRASLIFQASVLSLHRISSLMSITYRQYIQAKALHMVHGVSSTTIQRVACNGSWSQHQCHGCDENGKYCAWGGNRNHLPGILGQCANHYTT